MLTSTQAAFQTNVATSIGGPFTTGRISFVQVFPPAVSENWTLTGKDDRDALGDGQIQLVAGALSIRTKTGPNSNRGWVVLQMGRQGHDAPALSPLGQAGAVGLIALAGAYVVRRMRRSQS